MIPSPPLKTDVAVLDCVPEAAVLGGKVPHETFPAVTGLGHLRKSGMGLRTVPDHSEQCGEPRGSTTPEDKGTGWSCEKIPYGAVRTECPWDYAPRLTSRTPERNR